MSENNLSFKNLLDIILKTTKKNAYILADRYLLKDVSIISKWKSNKILPRSEDIHQIVDFALNESSETQRRIIQDMIEKIISDSSLNEDIKSTILNTGSFGDFLTEALNVSTCVNDITQRSDESIEAFADEKNVKDNIENKKSKKDSFTGVTESIDGEYSGVVKFDMILNKKDEGEHQINLNSLSFIERNLIGKIRKHNKKITVTGVIVLAITLNFFIIQMVHQNQNGVAVAISDRIVKDGKIPPAKDEDRETILDQVQKQGATIDDKNPNTSGDKETEDVNSIITPIPSSTTPSNPGYTEDNAKTAHTGNNGNSKTRDTYNIQIPANESTVNIGTINNNYNTINNFNQKDNSKNKEVQSDNEINIPDNVLLFNPFKNVKVDVADAHYVRLSWGVQAGLYKTTKVYRKEGGITSNALYRLIGKIPNNYRDPNSPRSFIDNSVKPDNTYTYRIYAEGTGDSLPLLSNELEARTRSTAFKKIDILDSKATFFSAKFDMGNYYSCFDNNLQTVARSANINPAFLQINFPDAKNVKKVRVFVGQPNLKATDDDRWSLEAADTQQDLDSKSGSYQLVVPKRDEVGGAWDETEISPITRKIWKFSFWRILTNDYVYLYEAELYE